VADAHRIAVAVDVVVLSLSGAAAGPPTADPGFPVVLLRQRPRDPFAGAWALPGGLLGPGEDLETAVHQVLTAMAGLPELRHLEQLATFGRPDRDPRGRVLSVSYLGLLPRAVPAGEGRWWPASDPPPLAFDHAGILQTAMERLRGKLSYSNVAYGLLPDRFTLSELQAVYEAVLDRPLDKRNFRKKVLSLGLLAEAEGQRRGSHRPAQLYHFSHTRLVLLDDPIHT
jgi:8-oxo-dGTP diphosphatase